MVWIILPFVITRLIILFAFDRYLSDVLWYFQLAESVVGKGLHAYKNFIYGYPPLSLSTIYLPYYLTTKYESYRLIYQLTNLFFDAVTLYFLWRFLRDRLHLPFKQVIK